MNVPTLSLGSLATRSRCPEGKSKAFRPPVRLTAESGFCSYSSLDIARLADSLVTQTIRVAPVRIGSPGLRSPRAIGWSPPRVSQTVSPAFWTNSLSCGDHHFGSFGTASASLESSLCFVSWLIFFRASVAASWRAERLFPFEAP